MQFWRYDVDEALFWMAALWTKPFSRPVLLVVAGVTAGVAIIHTLASLG
jgi:hypothetical protein